MMRHKRGLTLAAAAVGCSLVSVYGVGPGRKTQRTAAARSAHSHSHTHKRETEPGAAGGRCLSQRSHGEHDTASKRQETTRGFMKTYRLLINTHARIHSCPVVAIFAGSRDQSSRRCLPPLPLCTVAMATPGRADDAKCE